MHDPAIPTADPGAEAADAKATHLALTYVVNGGSGSALDKSALPVDGVPGEQFERLVR